MNVAVTGASGFCGSAIAHRLMSDGHRVVSIGRNPGPRGTTHQVWDACGESPPDFRGVDAVIHVAAAVGDTRSAADSLLFHRVNVGGTKQVLAARRGRPLVVVSSASVYDPRSAIGMVDEQCSTRSGHLNAYGTTKAAADALAVASGAVVIRPRAVYGPGDTTLMPRLNDAVRFGRLFLPGADVGINLTHVMNLATACVAAVSWPPGPYNVTDGITYSRDGALRQVLNSINAHPVRIRHIPRSLATSVARGTRLLPLARELTPYAVDQLSRRWFLNLTKARVQGWKPTLTLDDFLALDPESADQRGYTGQEC